MTYRNPGFIIPPQFPDDLRAKPEYVQKIKAYIEYGMSYLISHPHLKCSKSLESFLVDDDATYKIKCDAFKNKSSVLFQSQGYLEYAQDILCKVI